MGCTSLLFSIGSPDSGVGEGTDVCLRWVSVRSCAGIDRHPIGARRFINDCSGTRDAANERCNKGI